MRTNNGCFRLKQIGLGVFAVACLVSAALLAPSPTHRLGAQSGGVVHQYTRGWNLVGGPTGTQFFGVGPLYTLQPSDSTYEMLSPGQSIQAGEGYWAYFASDSGMVLNPGSSAGYQVFVPAGRYIMVGDPNGLVPAVVTGADVVLTYDPATGYQQSTTLSPGAGGLVYSARGSMVTVTPLLSELANGPAIAINGANGQNGANGVAGIAVGGAGGVAIGGNGGNGGSVVVTNGTGGTAIAINGANGQNGANGASGVVIGGNGGNGGNGGSSLVVTGANGAIVAIHGANGANGAPGVAISGANGIAVAGNGGNGGNGGVAIGGNGGNGGNGGSAIGGNGGNGGNGGSAVGGNGGDGATAGP